MGFESRGDKGGGVVQDTAGQGAEFQFLKEFGEGFPIVGFP